MEILVILLFIVLIILIVSFRGRALERIGDLEREIARLRKDLEATPRPMEAAKKPVEPVTRPVEAARDKMPEPVASPKESEPFVPVERKRPVPSPEIQPGAEITKPHVFQPTSSSGFVKKS